MFNILRPQPPWAAVLERARREFEEVQPLDDEMLAQMAAWLLIEHIFHDLRLDGIKLARRRIEELTLRGADPKTLEDRLALNYRQAIEHASQLVTSAETSEGTSTIELTTEILRRLHRLALGEEDETAGAFRVGEVNPLYPHHIPAHPREVPRLVDVAMEWFAADSVRELHPVEQAVLVHVRLYELQPFGKASGRITRLAASLYTLRAGYPPIIVEEDDTEAYYQGLLSGFQMATQPLIELFARSLGRTLRQMTEIVKSSRTSREGGAALRDETL